MISFGGATWNAWREHAFIVVVYVKVSTPTKKTQRKEILEIPCRALHILIRQGW